MLIAMMIVGALVLALILAAVPHLIWVIAWLIARSFHATIPYAPFGWTTLALIVICWSILAYGYYIGRFRYQNTSLNYTNPTIPAQFNGYKIVHISDLHLSTFDDRPSALQNLVDQINAQHLDLVCFTGDLVTMGVDEAKPYTSILQQIHANDGVISILGNHDFLIYSTQYKTDAEREAAVETLADYERNTLGWHLLRNQHYTITHSGDTITILGVDNANFSGQGFATINRADLSQALAGTGGFRILLSHDPSHWRGEVLPKTDIPLTLSGHTHAAQIRIFGWNPSSLWFSESDGLYTFGNQSLYINIGLGCTAPIRLGANAEITTITLHRN